MVGLIFTRIFTVDEKVSCLVNFELRSEVKLMK